jgi:hypothetical protein
MFQKAFVVVLNFCLTVVGSKLFLEGEYVICQIKIARCPEMVRGVGFEPTNLYRIGASGLRL